MTSKQLDRALERAVADALGVPLPRKHKKPSPRVRQLLSLMHHVQHASA
jgi:hypothetical protein